MRRKYFFGLSPDAQAGMPKQLSVLRSHIRQRAWKGDGVADMPQPAFHHGIWARLAIFVEKMLFERARVHTDTDGTAMIAGGPKRARLAWIPASGQILMRI